MPSSVWIWTQSTFGNSPRMMVSTAVIFIVWKASLAGILAVPAGRQGVLHRKIDCLAYSKPGNQFAVESACHVPRRPVPQFRLHPQRCGPAHAHAIRPAREGARPDAVAVVGAEPPVPQ